MLSLLISAAISTFRGRTDNLYFCNANIYRSTGTIRQNDINTFYVRDMRVEQTSSRSNRNLQKKKIIEALLRIPMFLVQQAKAQFQRKMLKGVRTWLTQEIYSSTQVIIAFAFYEYLFFSFKNPYTFV